MEKGVKLGIDSVKKIVFIEGPLGKLVKKFSGKDIIFFKKKVLVLSKSSSKEFYSILNGMSKSVVYGHFINLFLEGRGYRLLRFGSKIYFKFSPTNYKCLDIPKGIKVLGFRQRLILFGLDKQEVFRLGNLIRQLRKVEPYKGKGVRVVGEELILKVGKQK